MTTTNSPEAQEKCPVCGEPNCLDHALRTAPPKAETQPQGVELLPCPLVHPIKNGVKFTGFSKAPTNKSDRYHIWCYDCGLAFEGQPSETAESVARRWNARPDLPRATAADDAWLTEIESACNALLLDVYDLSIANAPISTEYARQTVDCIGHRVGQIRESVAAIRAPRATADTEKAAQLADDFARRLRSINNHATAAGVEVLAKEIRELTPRATGETLEPHKAINFLAVLEHQAHRNHEYHPGHCAECTMTETIANKLREQLGLVVRAATRTEGEGE